MPGLLDVADLDPHRRGAVVRGVRLPGHRVHARAVVVRALCARRRQRDRLRARAACRQRPHRVRSDLRVRRRDRRVRRAVVAQPRRRRLPVARVGHRRRQRELHVRLGVALAHRRITHHEVRLEDHLQGVRFRTVVRRIGLAGHGVDAGPVVVDAEIRRPGHRHTPAHRASLADGNPNRGNLRIRCRDGRVRRVVVAQRGRCRASGPHVPRYGVQSELLAFVQPAARRDRIGP